MDQAYEPELAVAGNIILPEFAAMPVIDSQSMSCRFRICTPRPDREGEIIEPSGVDWSDYQFAPTVKYEHGFTGVPFPVARSADANGMLHVNFEFDEDAIYARAFHSENNELSYQTFGLIEEGFIRAASIHVLPISYSRLGNDDDSPVHAHTSQLLEWSECTVGVNPDAYAKALTRDSKISEVLNLQLEASERILAKGTIGGRKLAPALAKCLQANKPPRTAMGTGTDFSKGQSDMAKSLTKEQVDALSPIGLAKAVSDPKEYDADTLKMLRFRAKSLDGDETLPKMANDTEDTMPKSDPDAETLGKSEDEPTTEEVEEPTATPTRPMGAEVMAAMHDGAGSLLANCEEALKAVENPQVQEFVGEFCAELKEQIAALEGAYASIYPEAPGLTSEDAEATEEMVKSWIASSKRNAYQLEGLAARLENAVGQDATKAKSLIQKTVGDLKMLASRAKSFTPKPQADQAQEQRIARLEKAVEKLVDSIGKKPAQV